jgi:hypothetical protein
MSRHVRLLSGSMTVRDLLLLSYSRLASLSFLPALWFISTGSGSVEWPADHEAAGGSLCMLSLRNWLSLRRDLLNWFLSAVKLARGSTRVSVSVVQDALLTSAGTEGWSGIPKFVESLRNPRRSLAS